MKKYGLLGYPLSHTMSPFIHERLFELECLQAEYKLYPIELLNKSEMNELIELDGFNITIPHKKAIIKHLNSLDKQAQCYQSVNTVAKNQNKLLGYNTDVYGFLKSIKTLGVGLPGRVLILGAGGVAQMAVVETAKQGGSITIAVRQQSLNKAQRLIEIAEKTNKVDIDIIDINNIKGEYDLLINCTPVGMYPNIEACPVSEQVVKNCKAVFDLIYNPYQTRLIQTAKQNNIPFIGGMSMLVYQAAKAHQIWNDSSFKENDFKVIETKANIFMQKHFNNNNNNTYVFIGFMASGKTTLAKAIAQKLKIAYVDIDEEIVRKAGITIPQIFENKGEEYFRKTETQMLNYFLDKQNIIISAGGGAPIYNRELLQKKAINIYIDTPFEICYERIQAEGGRPIASSKSKEELLLLYQKRAENYQDIADIKINGALSLEQKILTLAEWI